MSTYENGLKFYELICAWQAFAGTPLRVTDAADVLTKADLDAAENMLRRLAVRFRTEDAAEWPELHKLADQIEKAFQIYA